MKKRVNTEESIIKNLSQLPNSELIEVDIFIKFLLYKKKNKENDTASGPKSLSGIWKNSGFEKIPDLEQDISSLRKEIDNNILNKSLD